MAGGSLEEDGIKRAYGNLEGGGGDRVGTPTGRGRRTADRVEGEQ